MKTVTYDTHTVTQSVHLRSPTMVEAAAATAPPPQSMSSTDVSYNNTAILHVSVGERKK